jgi:hypothetical protein
VPVPLRSATWPRSAVRVLTRLLGCFVALCSLCVIPVRSPCRSHRSGHSLVIVVSLFISMSAALTSTRNLVVGDRSVEVNVRTLSVTVFTSDLSRAHELAAVRFSPADLSVVTYIEVDWSAILSVRTDEGGRSVQLEVIGLRHRGARLRLETADAHDLMSYGAEKTLWSDHTWVRLPARTLSRHSCNLAHPSYRRRTTWLTHVSVPCAARSCR